MNMSDIKYRISSTASLSAGSFLTEEDLYFYSEGRTAKNIPFGQSEKDFVQFSVYTFDETFITSSIAYSPGTWTPHTNSYYNVFNRPVQYYYDSFTTDWLVLGTETQSLFFDVSRNLNSLGISDGNYKVCIELGRDEVGNKDERLLIDSISNSRTEITLIPKTLKGSTGSINIEYDIFSNNQIQVSDVADSLIYSISKPELYNLYLLAKKQDPTGSAALMFNYGFKQDVDVTTFITDLYYGVRKGGIRSNGQYSTNDILGIYDQFKNLLYENYSSGITFQDIKNYYYSLFVFIADQELNRISNNKPSSYSEIVNFLARIYYNFVFFPHITSIENNVDTNLTGYFKHYIALPNGMSISILNKKSIPSTDPRFYDRLALKLESPLPVDVILGSDAWITNCFGFLPIVQNLYYFSQRVIQTFPLRGPNFLIKIENEGNSTEALSMETLIRETGSLYNELITKLDAKQAVVVDTIDYREFKNFVNFSSATFRLGAFDVKRSSIEKLYGDIQEYDAQLLINPNDQFYQKNKTDANSEIDSLEASMDGYEKFLYDNPMWFTRHAEVVDGYSTASLYDKDNGGALVSNLPQFLVEAYSDNEDYIKFIAMVGHFFDNLTLAVRQMTDKNDSASSPNSGVSLDVVGDMLKSLGWDVEMSKENLSLLLSSFCKADFDEGTDLYNQSRQFSEETRNKTIWKRILNSLPLIYKTKGTETSLNALISCFGVPTNLIKIKEYGGIQNVSDLTDTSLYIIDEVKYEPYFSGSGEYFQINWTGSAQSLEFNFRFDAANIHDEGQYFRLVNCSDVWALGARREKGKDWGIVFFSIDDGFGNVRTVATSRAPIFDGNSYHVLLRRGDVAPEFHATSSYNEYATKYDLILQKSEDDRITFVTTGSAFLSGSYNTAFESGSFIYVGNYNQNTSSVNIDPEAFFGNIDDINIWESPISNNRFQSHTLNRSSYDLESPQQMILDNLFRISFERPVDLYDLDGVTLNNLSFRNDFSTFNAINFPRKAAAIEQATFCGPSDASVFPYQFSRKDVRFTMHVPDYGANKFRSNKINYIEQELVGDLSSDTRASMQSSQLSSVDSNRLGIFFSPSEIQNKEIIKFFGEYQLGDLIGNPADVYQNSYKKFETFKQIYYEQGFGNVDYQFFMNVIRFYFDKAMFKYIRSIVPARAKLVDGILIEPSILERPKIAFKPMKKENIGQREGHAAVSEKIAGSMRAPMDAVLTIKNSGAEIYSDVNSIFFPSDSDLYGPAVYSQGGVTFYKDEYYRADVIKIKKSYQVWRDVILPAASSSQYDQRVNLGGRAQTVTSSYYKVNLTKLPTIYEYPITMSSATTPPTSGRFYFSGSVSFDPSTSGVGSYATSTGHSLIGVITGSIFGSVNSLVLVSNATINSQGLYMVASYIPSSPVTYSGNFYTASGIQYFDGTVQGAPQTALYYSTFMSTGSIFQEFKQKTVGNLFGILGPGVSYSYSASLLNYPHNATPLNGYFQTHHKHQRNQFSYREITSYDSTGRFFKWKKGSQNKKTTVNVETGLLDNSSPVETKTV